MHSRTWNLFIFFNLAIFSFKGTGVSIWDTESATCGFDSYQSLQRLHSAPPRPLLRGGGDRFGCVLTT